VRKDKIVRGFSWRRSNILGIYTVSVFDYKQVGKVLGPRSWDTLDRSYRYLNAGNPLLYILYTLDMIIGIMYNMYNI